MVSGRPTRLGAIRSGDIYEVCHTLFLLEVAEVADDLARDVIASELDPALAGLRTLDSRLASDVEVIGRIAATTVRRAAWRDRPTGSSATRTCTPARSE